MLFYLIFRFWFALALHVYAFFHAWMPTSHLLRWIDTDRGIKWGLPIGAALAPLYYLAMTWSGGHLNVDSSGWWWVPTVWGAMNTIKFAHVAIRSPIVWVHRTLHVPLGSRSSGPHSVARDEYDTAGARRSGAGAGRAGGGEAQVPTQG